MKNNTWDIFYLGYFSFQYTDNIFTSKIQNQNIIQYNPWGGHAYCLNRNTMKKILLTYKKYIGILQLDFYYSDREIFKNYCILPSMFEQYFCYDIDNTTENTVEYLIRKSQCFFGDYININSNITFLLYIYNKYYYILYIILIYNINNK